MNNCLNVPHSFVCVCVYVCGLLWGANGFQLPSNTVVEGACSAYENVCVSVCFALWWSI